MRLSGKFVHLFLAGALMLLFAGCASGPSVEKIEPFDEVVRFSPEQQAFLLKAARKGLSGEAIPAFPAALQSVEGGGAVIEVFLSPQKPIITVVWSRPFRKAFGEAVKRTAAASGFSRMKSNLDEVRIKVGVVDRIQSLNFNPDAKSEKTFRRIRKQTESAIHGFILVHVNGKVFYQIPEAVLYEGLGMKGQKRFMGRKLVARQLRELGRDAEGDSRGWANGELFSFTTFTFIDDVNERGKAVISYRSKNLVPRMTTESLRQAAIANADYLAKSVTESGKFKYIYYPAVDKYEGKSYSIVRHAGSVYGLFDAYNHFKDQKYFDAGRKAMDYLLERTEVPSEVPSIAIVKDRGRSSLGTNALAAMAYSAMAEELMTEQDLKYRDQFGESIRYYQMPEKGLFYTYFKQAFGKKPPSKQALYYPGEAMLALVKLYEATGAKKWWDAAKDIAPGQKKLWENAGHQEVGNYCWVGQAFARMARIEKDEALREEYRKVAYSHADAVIKHQYDETRSKYPDYIGGADNSRPPRTTPTSARGESVSENYLLAKFLGDTEAQKKYGVSVLRAIHFFVENQWSAQNSWFLPYPEKAIGGVRGSLIANDIRIDYNQHALTTEMNALNVIDDLKALGVTNW